jgi:hypothetical protein
MKFFEIKDYEKKLSAISIFIGGRGIGKTYSAFSYVFEEKPDKPFIYMRNTAVQLDECCGAFGNPFKRWAKDHCRTIWMEKEKNHAVIYEETPDGVKTVGFGVALSTFENLRGVDLSDVDYVIFDEFCERRRFSFDQFKSFQYFYETVNRNRELFGEPPLICILLSNAQKLDTPILAGYDVIRNIEGMVKRGQNVFRKGKLLICMPTSEISELKKLTANYQLIKGTKIADEALDNKFANDSFYGVVKRPLKEYIGMCAIDGIYIYKHKSNGKLYACRSRCENVMEFNSKDNRSLFLRSYGRGLDLACANGSFEFSDYQAKAKMYELLMID